MTKEIEQAINRAIEQAKRGQIDAEDYGNEYAMQYWSAYLDGVRGVKYQIEKIEVDEK